MGDLKVDNFALDHPKAAGERVKQIDLGDVEDVTGNALLGELEAFFREEAGGDMEFVKNGFQEGLERAIEFILMEEAMPEKEKMVMLGRIRQALEGLEEDKVFGSMVAFVRGEIDSKSNKVTDFADQAQNGGIDLNPVKDTLKVRNEGVAMKFNIDPVQFEEYRSAPGFTPVIINIQPMTDLPAFLGINGVAAKAPLAMDRTHVSRNRLFQALARREEGWERNKAIFLEAIKI